VVIENLLVLALLSFLFSRQMVGRL